ncbi:MAG: FtsH protease activity modulator HflK [Planctomycetes bacterium]|nr:FtsH protease activity modulator HflK [Planctomycetota bacterium]
MAAQYRGSRDRPLRPEDIPWDRILLISTIALVVMTVVYVVFSAVYRVEAHEKAVVFRLGEYHNTSGPGLHTCIPIVDRVVKVSVEDRSLRLPMDGSSERTNDVAEGQTLVLTGDLNAASVEWTIQWKVNDPLEFVTRFYKADNADYPQDVLRMVAQTVMHRLVGDHSFDEVLTAMRGEIAEEARLATQEILNRYECGIEILGLQMQRVSPPARVRPAFEEVNASIQLEKQSLHEAERKRNELLPKAEAEASKLRFEAKGYAARREAEADGEIESLNARATAYHESPVETRTRLYLEAMEEIMAGVESKTVIEAPLGRIWPLLNSRQGVEQ